MNRLLLLLCCICVPWMARGQAAYEWLYWFDMNHASRVNGQSIGDCFTITTDVNGLSEGFHTIHVQVADTAGKYSPPHAQLFFHTKNRTITRLYYWFDKNVTQVHSIATSQDNLSIDVSELETGLHFIYCQVEDAAGLRSDITCRVFYRQAIRSALKWAYWFDEDKDSRITVPLPNEMTMIDVSELQDGFHVLHNQVFDTSASDVVTTMFIKVPQTEGIGDMTCICIVDGKLVAKEMLPTSGGILKWDMDVENMDVGIHKAMFQVITPSGAASSIAERYFVRAITNKELGSMKCVYAIDNFQTFSEAGTLSNGLFHFDLNVSTIENGLHRIAYMLVSEEGVTTPQQTAFFWKTPLGGEGIVQYNYWVNDNDEQKRVVKLDKHQDPFNLITLLPVEAQPIRSSNFQFTMKNGEPLIYARNEFHIQFYDTNGRLVEETKEYYDEQVSAAVEPVGELQATQTFEKIAENDIRWYTVEASKGDYLEFMLDRAATIQLFAPSGEEAYCASGADVVKWGGCHVNENGTYYLALHDVTAQQGTTITLDYRLTSRYAVLHHTPDIVGNAQGSYFTVHLNGNGFDKLVDASLIQGDHIFYMDSLLSTSCFKADIQFHIVDHPIVGNNDLILSFVDEDGENGTLTVKDAIVFEEANYADIKVEMINKSNVRPYPLSVKLKNEGNMSYSYIPLNIAWDNPQQANDVTFKNFYATVAEVNDSAGYQPIVYTNNLLGKGIDGVVMFFYIPELGPYETMELQLGFSAPAHSHFNIYAWTGTPLELDTLTLNAQPERGRRKANTSNRGSNILSFGDNLQSVTGSRVMPNAVQNAGQIANNAIKIGATIGSMQNVMGRSLGRSQIEALGGDWEEYKDIYEGLYPEVLTPGQIIGGDVGDGVDQLMNNQRECANNPDPNPDSSHHGHIAVPVDPNDIFGYLSEAGSKFIADSVARVNYTIEFENDTTFATAAAHTIVIRDTLDSRYFNLTKFMPTGVRIGGHDVFLNEADIVTNNDKTSFVKTIDMRPEINAIAQVNGEYNQKNGIAEWRFTSLDPMTMEPTDDLMQGILPVNYDGTSGIGEVMFEIGVKQGKADGTELKNRAGIVFDYEEAILTPTWTNIVDAVAPSSVIDNSWMVNDSTLRITADGFDARSGVWKYEWYVQAGENAPWWKEGETESASFDYHIYEGIDYGFCVLAVDSAGNVEQKVIQRERGFKTYGPDYEDNISPVLTSPEVEGPVYDLSGRKHDEPQENQINIIDKKKILFRRKGK